MGDYIPSLILVRQCLSFHFPFNYTGRGWFVEIRYDLERCDPLPNKVKVSSYQSEHMTLLVSENGYLIQPVTNSLRHKVIA